MTISTQPASIFSGFIYNWEEKTWDNHLHVICKDTNQLWNIGDKPKELRAKFAILALFGTFKSTMQVAIRIYTICRGDFVTYAKKTSNHEWINTLECEENDKHELLKRRIYKAIAKEFILEIGKTVLMILAIVPLILTSIFGIIFPYDGRKLLSDIETIYAPTRWSPFIAAAPCMDDHDFRSRETLHYFNKYHLEAKGHLLAAQKARIIHHYKPYFEAKGLSYEILEYKALRDIINKAKDRPNSQERELD